MIGWLLDTNVVSAIINPKGAATVKAWAAAQDEGRLFLSILTLGEYDRGIHNVPDDHSNRRRFIAARDGLAARFAGRIQSVGDPVVRRWGVISGTAKRLTGHSPPVIDTLFAATALEHDLYLVTRNLSDVRTSGAQIFDPWNNDPQEFPLSPTPLETRDTGSPCLPRKHHEVRDRGAARRHFSRVMPEGSECSARMLRPLAGGGFNLIRPFARSHPRLGPPEDRADARICTDGC